MFFVVVKFYAALQRGGGGKTHPQNETVGSWLACSVMDLLCG